MYQPSCRPELEIMTLPLVSNDTKIKPSPDNEILSLDMINSKPTAPSSNIMDRNPLDYDVSIRLVTRDGKSVVSKGSCCFPCPCLLSVCICSELKVSESEQQPLELYYDSRAHTLRRKDGCGEFIGPANDILEVDKALESCTCVPFSFVLDTIGEKKFIVTRDGYVVSKHKPHLVVGISGSKLVLVDKNDEFRRVSFRFI